MLVGIYGSAGIDYVISEKVIGDRGLRSTVTLIGSKPSDAGQYVCVARNNVTYVQESAFLEVYGKLVWPCTNVHNIMYTL